MVKVMSLLWFAMTAHLPTTLVGRLAALAGPLAIATASAATAIAERRVFMVVFLLI